MESACLMLLLPFPAEGERPRALGSMARRGQQVSRGISKAVAILGTTVRSWRQGWSCETVGSALGPSKWAQTHRPASVVGNVARRIAPNLGRGPRRHTTTHDPTTMRQRLVSAALALLSWMTSGIAFCACSDQTHYLCYYCSLGMCDVAGSGTRYLTREKQRRRSNR